MAIDDEFPGYFHLHGVSMTDFGGNDYDMYGGDVNLLTMQAFQTECDTNSSCQLMMYDWSFPSSHGWLHKYHSNALVDTYFKNSSCGSQCSSAVPSFVKGGLYGTNVMYMKCSGCKMVANSFDSYLNVYQSSPGNCATACNEDSRCTAMSISNDRQMCYTYAYTGPRTYDAYFKVPM